MNYHIEVWGSTTAEETSKIDNMLVNIAKYIHNDSIGRTDDFYFKK